MLFTPRTKLTQVLNTNSNMRKFSGHICENFDLLYEKKPHVFMGVGFVSSKEGLSMGVPMDIISMILNGLSVATSLGDSSNLIILLADHQALASVTDDNKETVLAMGEKYFKKLNNIKHNLPLGGRITILRSSDLIAPPVYQALLKDIQRREQALLEDNSKRGSDTHAIIAGEGHYNPLHLEYFNEQIALTQYLFEQEGCGVKIGWTKHSSNNEIKKANRFCEAHFDRFYRDLYEKDKEKVSFVYSISGFNLEKRDFAGREIPYTAPAKENAFRLFCSKKQALPENKESINPEFVKAMKRNADYIREALKVEASDHSDIETDISLIRHICQKPVAALTVQYEALSMKKAPDEQSNDAVFSEKTRKTR